MPDENAPKIEMMMGASEYGKAIDILQRTMDVNLLRQDIIANNIANADTPNFKRTTLNFETKLSEALASEGRPLFRAARTHPGHIDFRRRLHYSDVRPRRVLDFVSSSKNNNNNVDIEVETTDLLNQQLLYTLMSSSVDALFDRVRLVLS